MRAVVQRVLSSAVWVEGKQVGQIQKGVNILLGVGHEDELAEVQWLAEKIAHLRIFEDEKAKMNLSLKDVGGSALVISQFTLYGDCEKGRRPSFTKAGEPKKAKALYEAFIDELKKWDIPVANGIFQADMKVEIINDGPVTLLIETPQKCVKKETPVLADNPLNLSKREQEKFEREAAAVRRNIQLRKQQRTHHG